MDEEVKYQDWIEKINQAAGITEQTIVKEVKREEKGIQKALQNPTWWRNVVICLGIFFIALLPRLIFIFVVSQPENAGVGWYGDTYHHWQIGYLTWTVGLKHGFLRLWDLKGMEFFWGFFHPMLLVIWFSLTGITSVAVTRVMSAVFGSASIVLLFLLTKRYFNSWVAWAIVIFSIVFPVAIFNDATGSLEEFGIFFLLLGIYFFENHAFWAGVAWVFAVMVRAEAWLFSLGLLFAILFLPEKQYGSKKIMIWIGWTIPMLLYMKYLFAYTGNPIYPVYWNFLANGLGTWANVQRILTPLQREVKPVLEILGVISGIAALVVLWKRPKSMLLLLLGIGNIFFVTAFMGFSHYITGWEWWFPVIRFFVFPYLFLALVFFVVVWKLLQKYPALAKGVLVFVVIFVSIASQWTWNPIMYRFNKTVSAWKTSIVWGQTVGKYYQGGSVLIPEGDPNFTYTLVTYGHVTGQHIVGEMYDPFFYIGEDVVFGDYSKYRRQILTWLKSNDIRLAVFRTDATRYNKLLAREPQLFDKITAIPGSENYVIYRVHSKLIPSNYAN